MHPRAPSAPLRALHPVAAACLVASASLAACSGTSDTAPIPPAGAPGPTPAADAASPIGDDAGAPPADAAAPTDADADAAPGESVPGTIAVDRATTHGAVGAAFAGLSYEKAHLADHYFAASNAPLVALFKLLGPSVLRVGGNSVDETTWSPDGAVDAGAATDAGAPRPITPRDVDDLAAFLRAADWKVIYGVNMKTSTADVAAAEAEYAAHALGDRLAGFEIGNECDLYKSTAVSPAAWSYAAFKSEWESFAAAIRAKVPGALLTGPASASNVAGFTLPFAKDEASRVSLLTQHYYRANGKLPTSTIDLLLAPDPRLATMLDQLESAATTSAIAGGYRLAEANSFYNGGASGVSDAYGTALWTVDFLFTNAEHGSSGVNLHGGGNGPGYTPIADANGAVTGVRPDYYGMLLFTLAGTGPLHPTKVNVPNVAVTAYAVTTAGGATNVVVVDKDPKVGVHASIDLGASAAAATVTRLTGPSLMATSGYTLGGAAVAPTGAWTPAPPSPLAVAGHVVTVDVPPASVALIHAK